MAPWPSPLSALRMSERAVPAAVHCAVRVVSLRNADGEKRTVAEKVVPLGASKLRASICPAGTLIVRSVPQLIARGCGSVPTVMVRLEPAQVTVNSADRVPFGATSVEELVTVIGVDDGEGVDITEVVEQPARTDTRARAPKAALVILMKARIHLVRAATGSCGYRLVRSGSQKFVNAATANTTAITMTTMPALFPRVSTRSPMTAKANAPKPWKMPRM